MNKFATIAAAILLCCQAPAFAQMTPSEGANEILTAIETQFPFYATIKSKYPDAYAQIVTAAERAGPSKDLAGFRTEVRPIVHALIMGRAPNLSASALVSMVESSIEQQRYLAANNPSLCIYLTTGRDFNFERVFPAEIQRREATLYNMILNDPGKGSVSPMPQDEYGDISFELAQKASKKLGLSMEKMVQAMQQQGPEEFYCTSQAEFYQGALSLPAEKRDSYLLTTFSP